MPLIMGLADRIIAMADGKIIASGPPEVIQNDPLVVEAYLGGGSIALERSGPAPRADAVPSNDGSSLASASVPAIAPGQKAGGL